MRTPVKMWDIAAISLLTVGMDVCLLCRYKQLAQSWVNSFTQKRGLVVGGNAQQTMQIAIRMEVSR